MRVYLSCTQKRVQASNGVQSKEQSAGSLSRKGFTNNHNSVVIVKSMGEISC